MFEVFQKFRHSFAGLGGPFENFHSWPHRLDVSPRGRFVKFHDSQRDPIL
jgi:hypothetical protein